MTPDEANATQLNWAMDRILGTCSFPFPPAVHEELTCDACRHIADVLYVHGKMMICFECREAMDAMLSNDSRGG